jgi:quinol monooxygenase YgiN
MPQLSPTHFTERRRLLLCAASVCMAMPAASITLSGSTTMTPATIEANTTLITLVNIFTVAPEDCERLALLLKEGTNAWISKVPGFVSSALHVARDKQRIVIYGQWRSAEAIAAMRQSAHMPAYFERVKALSTMESIVCEVASALVAAGD